MINKCAHCGKVIVQTGRGRPRKYCNEECRKLATPREPPIAIPTEFSGYMTTGDAVAYLASTGLARSRAAVHYWRRRGLLKAEWFQHNWLVEKASLDTYVKMVESGEIARKGRKHKAVKIDGYLSVRAAVKYLETLGVVRSKQSVYHWWYRGLLKGKKITKRKLVIEKASLDRYAEIWRREEKGTK